MEVQRKRIVTYTFPKPDLTMIKHLIGMASPGLRTNFSGNYGRLLKFVYTISDYEKDALYTLLQFFDPSLRCFVFPDYILAPTLEEFSFILGIPIQQEIVFFLNKELDVESLAVELQISESILSNGVVEREGFKGFLLKFLVDRAERLAEEKNWIAFQAVLALCIYGIVLFPNVPDVVDMQAVRLFLSQNPVPTLLGDVYYSVHHKNENRRGRSVNCCAPLLATWYLNHLPKTGAFIDSIRTMSWSERVMGLVADDIIWFDPGLMGVDIIYKGGEFLNIPLIGRKGGINYNPSLLIRQFGYALRIPPESSEVVETFIFHGIGDQKIVFKVVHAWKHWVKKGKDSFGKCNNQALPPYIEWVQKRVETKFLPYPLRTPLYPQMIQAPTTIEIEKYDKLRAEVETLRKENRELSREVNGLRHEKNEAKHIAKVNSEILKATKLELAREIKAKEIVLEALEQSDMVVASKKKELEHAWSRIAKFNISRNNAITANKAKEDQYLDQIAQLKAKLQVKDKEIKASVAENRELEKKFRDMVADMEQLKVQAEVKRARGEGSSTEEAAAVDDWELHGRYPTGILHRRDVLICELIRRPNHPNTRKLLKEIQNWCKTHDEWGILARLDLDDVP